MKIKMVVRTSSLLLVLVSNWAIAQRDTVLYRITYRDTVIYRTDTVLIKDKRQINLDKWGIGPNMGAFYSPIGGVDAYIGVGIQYSFTRLPIFRKRIKRKHR